MSVSRFLPWLPWGAAASRLSPARPAAGHYENLQDEGTRGEAAVIFRSLVSEVTLAPDNGELAIILRGDLGAILQFAVARKDSVFLHEAEGLDNLLTPGS
jgi:site-specific DNA recombinase